MLHPVIGPGLPPRYKASESSSSSEDSDQEEVVFKRAKYSSSSRNRPSSKPPVIGPALPPGFKRQDADEDEEEEKEGARGYLGPALPPGCTPEVSSGEGEEEDVYIVGPVPSKGPSQDSVALDFERRAQRMKDKLTGVDTGPKVVSRESWMTELPPELQHVGLEARIFKKRSGPENKDRSVWTDTPAKCERKARERLEAKEKGESAKDDGPRLSQKELEMAEKVSKYNESKRGESLISMHTQKMKRKAEEDANKPVERRPFDRDTDLQVNRFDEAQKKALLKKSQELNTCFSHSKDRMFL